jgi:hypothetical protein
VNRIIGIAGAMLLSLFVLLPVAAAAEPFTDVRHVIVSSGGDVTIPAGQHVDALIVTDGTATISGDVDGMVVVNGAARFVGGQAGSVVAVGSQVSLDATSSVSGDIRTFDSTVDRETGAVVEGRVIDGATDVDWTGAAQVAWALSFLALIGFVVVGLIAGLTAAGLASSQVRSAGATISREPGMTLVAAFAGLFGIIAVSLLAVVTVVGIPAGLAMLIVVLPALFFVGWLVAAIWLGEWILGRLTPDVTRERPYLAAVIGVLVLDLVAIVPAVGVVGVVVAFFGFGAVVLTLWRTFRGQRVTGAGTASVAPVAG